MNVSSAASPFCQGESFADEDLPPHVREKRPADFLGAAVARRMSLAESSAKFIERVLEDEAGNKTAPPSASARSQDALPQARRVRRSRGEVSAPAPAPSPPPANGDTD